ncbi:hypothetical protein CVT24_002838 [Panaeolus cyanescens]|uniref:Metallo-beta-lactamase domain-containing protein n=1 Tax=Panaeolus cyanescens TaxID=181874 RepID=A0A409VMU5_9AGAR|nr:hypothetical protein CVT24_002838 [Panaeolus cyanescens]
MPSSTAEFRGRPDDLIIALICLREPGSQGSKEISPKSAFIAAIDATYQAQTNTTEPLQWINFEQGSDIRACRIHLDVWKQNIVLVDTPAFDRKSSETMVMSRLEEWLQASYPVKRTKPPTEPVHFAGILYFCSIEDALFGPNADVAPNRVLYNHHCQSFYETLCGKDNAKKIGLITGMWGELDDAKQQAAQEAENRIAEEHWAEMINLGSRMERLTSENGNDILEQTIRIACNEPVVSEQNIFSVAADDVIIACMGPTGSGKSNFIKKVCNHHCTDDEQNDAPSGKEQLTSVTSRIVAYRLRNHPTMKNRIVLVDTPGFDDTHLSDMDVLKMLGKWLSKTYRKHTMLAGILYFHRITDNRVSGTANRNIRMFGKLCGSKAAEKVVIVTTMWDAVAKQDENKQKNAQERLKELQSKYWKGLMDNHARTKEFNDEPATAMKIIGLFFNDTDTRTGLRLQQEIVDVGLPIKQTDAGIALADTLIKRMHALEDKIKENKRAERDLDEDGVLRLSAENESLAAEVKQIKATLKELKVNPLARSTFMATPEALPDVTKLSDHVVRILGQNPGKFTLQGKLLFNSDHRPQADISPPTGTNTYLIGSQNPYILVDTAEGKPEYASVLSSALEGVCAPVNPDLPDVSDIIISHWHGDHVGGITSVLPLLKQLWEARNPGKAYVPPRLHKYPLDTRLDGEHKSDYYKLPHIIKEIENDKGQYKPTSTGGVFHDLHDNQTFIDPVSGGVLLRVLHTPGHTIDSISLYVPQDRALYTADTVLGHGTAVFEDLATYLASLNRMLHFGTDKGKDFIPGGDIDLQYVNLYPAHGAVVVNGRETIATYIKHRLEREAQVLKTLQSPIPAEVAETEEEKEHWSTWTIVKVLYKSYPNSLWLPAARGINLHLRKLEGEGLIQRVGGEGKDVRWKLLVSPPRSPSL